MAKLEVEQTVTFMHSFEVKNATEDDLDDFISDNDFDTLDDVKCKLCEEFGSDNVTFIEDGSGSEELDFY